MAVINCKIDNISENIGWVLFKLENSNLNHVRHKMIPSMLLPWQPIFAAGAISHRIDVVVYCCSKTCSLSVSLYRDVRHYANAFQV